MLLALLTCLPCLAADAPPLIFDVGTTLRLDAQALLPDADLKGSTFAWRLVTDPDVAELIARFQCPTDWADDYGTRVSGLLWPPATGEYTFWIASDDNGELRLSTDRDPGHAKLVASVADWTAPQGWEQFPGQKSQPIRLEAGKAYYAPRPDPDALPELAAVPADATTVALSAARWVSAEVGWESPGYGLHGSGKRFFPAAIYAHAPSRYVYRPEGKWRSFESIYGLARGNPGSVIFVVKGDGKELFRSELVKDFEERTLKVDIAGVQELELIVEDGGNGRNCDHGVWFTPMLSR